MFSASQLTEEQKETIKSWVAGGDQMADVQRRMLEEFEVKLTYMDTRFLSLDLGLEFVSEEAEEPEIAEEEAEKPVDELTADDVELVPPPEGGFQPVAVTVDSVGRPGAMVSGRVTFSDGQGGSWMIDDMGRPSVDPDTAGYRPSEADLVEFQGKLREALEGHM